MPVLECYYETTDGQELGYVVPMSKISHLSCSGIGEVKEHYLHTMSGARLKIGQADYDKLHKIILEQEGAKEQ